MDRTALIHDIRSLMQAPADGVHAPDLERLEHTLTDGYAHALGLESERLRLERRLGRITDDHGADPKTLAREITALTKRLRDTDFNLRELRLLLDTLRRRASEVRAA